MLSRQRLTVVAFALLAGSCDRRAIPVDGNQEAARGDLRRSTDSTRADLSPHREASPDRTLGVGCTAAGGHCVPGKWAHCPAGYEPTADIHSDCMPPTAVRGYFCCVPAPTSPCSSNAGGTNCFAGKCELCWNAIGSSLTCEAGRICCSYVCPD